MFHNVPGLHLFECPQSFRLRLWINHDNNFDFACKVHLRRFRSILTLDVLLT